MSLRLKVLPAALLLAVFGCTSPEFRYVPTGAQSGVDSFGGDATFPMKDSGGNVRVTSLGIAELTPKGGGDKIHSLHLRMALSNQGTGDWQLRIEDQTVSFPNHPKPSIPLVANSDSRLLADIGIPAKSLRTIDLFYALPKGWEEAKDLPEFDFHWKVLQGNGAEERSISFARQEIPEYVASGLYPYGYGPSVGLGWGEWWWGPSTGPYVSYRQ